MTKLALKIDVDTYRGTSEGVPRLIEVLRRNNVRATFLFSLGPDHTGRAIKRVFRPGFMKKVQRTSVASHYGLMTLLYGTLLPGPDIGRRCAEIMRATRDAGFETGIHCWDHVRWQDRVELADAAWTEDEMQKAIDRYVDVFGEPARGHGAAGWQMNSHALRLTEKLGFAWSSDTRGKYPFIPVINGEVVNCPQLPTTLPTLDELIGVDGIDDNNVHDHLLQLTTHHRESGHVYTLHAELEGNRFAPVFERLLSGWRKQNYQIVAMRDLYEDLNPSRLPHCEIMRGEVPGRSGTLLIQGNEL